jgi:hypothetical protein
MRQLLEQRLALIDSVPEQFITRAQAAERAAIREILSLLGELEVKDGRIVNSSANLAKVDRIFAASQRVFDEPYRRAVGSFLGDIDKVHALNVQYFGSQGIEQEAKFILDHGKANALKVLGEGGVVALNNIRTVLDIAVTSGATVPELTRQLKMFTGVSRHAKTYAVDLLTVIDRSYTTKIAEDFGFEWFWYLGGIIKDSRCFCVERHEKYYHKTEVEEWGRRPDLWAGSGKLTILGGVCKGGGRNPLTNERTIFTLAGGYNCRHIIVPVSESVVPQSVKDRI